MSDFRGALAEIKPAFGAVIDTLESYRSRGMTNYGARMQKLLGTCDKLVRQVPLLTHFLCLQNTDQLLSINPFKRIQ